MNPAYDPEEHAFDATTLGLFRITATSESGPRSAETYRAILQYYEAHPEGWVPSEREEILKRLSPPARSERRASTARSSASEPVSASVTADASAAVETSPLPLTTLSKEDRIRYDSALQAETRGQFREAWQSLLPILETNSRVFEVQELRCRLARRQHLFASVEEAHCAPAAELRGAVTR